MTTAAEFGGTDTCRIFHESFCPCSDTLQSIGLSLGGKHQLWALPTKSHAVFWMTAPHLCSSGHLKSERDREQPQITALLTAWVLSLGYPLIC